MLSFPGSLKRRIGGEVSVQLDYEPGRFSQLRTVLPKYVRNADRSAPPVIAELPPKLIEGGIATPGLLTEIVIGKYCDHLPLYRQEKIFGQRHDVELPRQTMSRWMEAVADWLKPIYRVMRDGMFTAECVGESKRGRASRPIVDRVIKALHRFKASRRHLPKSLMGRAINYALNQESELRVYLTNGNVGITPSRTPSARPPSARRTACSSDRTKPVGAAP